MYLLNLLLYEIEWFALVMQPHIPYQMANTYHTSSSSTLSPNHTPHQFHHLQHCDYPHSHHNQHSHQFFQQQPQHLGVLDSSLHPQEQSTTTASFWYNSFFFSHSFYNSVSFITTLRRIGVAGKHSTRCSLMQRGSSKR
ncbi:hypothetical protein V8G54_007576 [Vigna mungo]|uniref:Uncharacterized protein n=1 Tax=Vigna mungo TaxID=3915 RepID=A0AAQ3S982_VIGMU